jgi:hypothetical protein
MRLQKDTPYWHTHERALDGGYRAAPHTQRATAHLKTSIQASGLVLDSGLKRHRGCDPLRHDQSRKWLPLLPSSGVAFPVPERQLLLRVSVDSNPGDPES